MTDTSRDMFQQQRNGNGYNINWGVILQLVSMLIGGLLMYSAVNARVAVVESRVDDMRDRIDNLQRGQDSQRDQLQEVKSDVKSLLRRK
jgi:hypothetical protein